MVTEFTCGEIVVHGERLANVQSIEIRRFYDGDLIFYNLAYLPSANKIKNPTQSGWLGESEIKKYYPVGEY